MIFNNIFGMMLNCFNHKEKLSSYGVTNKGMVRENNEDFLHISKDKRLCIVADGMGGHNAGEIASQKATKFLFTTFSEDLRSLLITAKTEEVRNEMTNALQGANSFIYNEAQNDIYCNGMGCAIIFALILDGSAHICHVGDTRAYLMRNNVLTLLTVDHSFVMEFVKNGEMTIDEARNSPLKNELTQAIGINRQITPGYTEVTLQPNDTLLLCSDGLWDMLSDLDIQETLIRQRDIKKAAHQLINTANDVGGHDNITTILISKNC
jgi:PPM family protein phosphatase